MMQEGKLSLEAGAVVEGKVVRIMAFGAFVDMGNRQGGLVHISEISNDYVNKTHNSDL